MAKKRKLNREQLQQVHEYRMAFQETVSSNIKLAVKCSALVAAIYFGVYKPIEISAGQETTISYALNVITNAKLEIAASLTANAAFATVVYVMRRRWLTERGKKDKRIAELENVLDPERSSSGMTIAGNKSLSESDKGAA